MSPTVLFTASTWSHIVNFHRPYLRAFHALGWQVHVACGGNALPVPEADRCISLPFEKKMSSPANFRAQRQLRRLMAETAYNLVCTHTSLAAFFTRRAAAGVRPRPPVVNVAHGYLFHEGTPPLRRAVLVAAERLTAPQTDLLLTMNRWDGDAARRYHLGRTVQSIPGIGVDFTRFSPRPPAERAALRAALGCGSSDCLLLYAAEFSDRKNQSALLRALAQTPPRVHLALPGAGLLLEECRALARSLGVADRVSFPGQVADMPLWYAAADGAVSASRSEGLPFNIMEAMYCGLPVAASAVKGHTDLICPGVTGLLFPPENPAAIAVQLCRLADDPAGAAAMAGAARCRVEAYSLDRVLPQVMAAYRSAARE